MRKRCIFIAAAMALSLTGCGGKSAPEQAAEDAAKINLDAAVPRMAAVLAGQCAQGETINMDCPADKAREFIRTYPAFIAAVGEKTQKCEQNYGAKMCGEGYGGLLADNVANKIIEPVIAGAKQSLQAKQAAERHAAALRAEAAKKAAEEAAQRAAAEKAKADAAAEKAKAEAAAAAEVSAHADKADAAAAAGAAEKAAAKNMPAAPAAETPAAPAESGKAEQ